MNFRFLKGWIKPLLQPDYRRSRELKRIKNADRYTRLSTDLLGPELAIVDGRSFFYSYKEIFEQEIYAFKTEKKDPLIIDGGANIGLSAIYLKQLYPRSRILAFEPDPQVFECLQANMLSFGYTDVDLINKALWVSEDQLEFAAEGADAGRLSRLADQSKLEKIPVETVRLCDQVRREGIAFLKLDIEGAETEVLLDCSDCLDGVENLFVEYHSFADEEQRLSELLRVLREAGFRIQIHDQFCSPQPLLSRRTRRGMDQQLNIFGYRT